MLVTYHELTNPNKSTIGMVLQVKKERERKENHSKLCHILILQSSNQSALR